MRSRTLPALFAATALALSACGGSDDETTTGPASNPGNAGQESGDPAPNTVTMKDIAFEPKSITVKQGDKVTWVNDDDVEHDVFSEGTPGLKSELFGKDGKYEYTTEKAGDIAYVCTVHPGMEGTITVE